MNGCMGSIGQRTEANITIGNHVIMGIILGRLVYLLPQDLCGHGECICTIAQLMKIRKFEDKIVAIGDVSEI